MSVDELGNSDDGESETTRKPPRHSMKSITNTTAESLVCESWKPFIQRLAAITGDNARASMPPGGAV